MMTAQLTALPTRVKTYQSDIFFSSIKKHPVYKELFRLFPFQKPHQEENGYVNKDSYQQLLFNWVWNSGLDILSLLPEGMFDKQNFCESYSVSTSTIDQVKCIKKLFPAYDRENDKVYLIQLTKFIPSYTQSVVDQINENESIIEQTTSDFTYQRALRRKEVYNKAYWISYEYTPYMEIPNFRVNVLRALMQAVLSISILHELKQYKLDDSFDRTKESKVFQSALESTFGATAMDRHGRPSSSAVKILTRGESVLYTDFDLSFNYLPLGHSPEDKLPVFIRRQDPRDKDHDYTLSGDFVRFYKKFPHVFHKLFLKLTSHIVLEPLATTQQTEL